MLYIPALFDKCLDKPGKRTIPLGTEELLQLFLLRCNFDTCFKRDDIRLQTIH